MKEGFDNVCKGLWELGRIPPVVQHKAAEESEAPTFATLEDKGKGKATEVAEDDELEEDIVDDSVDGKNVA
jgi:hypothetical protein